MQVVSGSEARFTREDVSAEGIRSRHTDFFGDHGTLHGGPQAYLVEKMPTADALIERGEVIVTAPHFHLVRQFQLIVRGQRSRIGKHKTPALSLQYTDPSSPYGPIFAGDEGIAWFTLRPRADLGAYFMPGARQNMRAKAGRNLVVNIEPKALPLRGVDHQALVQPHDDGLASFRVRLGPHEIAAGPDPTETGGQYYYVASGTLIEGSEVIDSDCLSWAAPNDERPALRGGPSGADIVILQFPIISAAEAIDSVESNPFDSARTEPQ